MSCTAASGTRSTRRARCYASTSRPVGWAARAVAGSTPTADAPPSSPRTFSRPSRATACARLSTIPSACWSASRVSNDGDHAHRGDPAGSLRLGRAAATGQPRIRRSGAPTIEVVQTSIERELKLEPPEGFVLPPLDGDPLETRVFTSTYHDTATRSLARCGITLRRRVEHGLSNWQLKLPRDDGRAEIEAAGGPAGPPDELRRLLAAHLPHGGLEAVATLRTRRSGVRVGGLAHPVADVTVDAVDILDGMKSVGGFVELEIELVDGELADLEKLG